MILTISVLLNVIQIVKSMTIAVTFAKKKLKTVLKIAHALKIALMDVHVLLLRLIAQIEVSLDK